MLHFFPVSGFNLWRTFGVPLPHPSFSRIPLCSHPFYSQRHFPAFLHPRHPSHMYYRTTAGKLGIRVAQLSNLCNSPGIEEVEEPRPTYWGEKRTSPITGETEYYYPPWKRKIKTYCVSYPIVILCMKLATVVMLLNFKFLHAVEARYNDVGGVIANIMLLLPSIVYAVVIAVLNNLYHQLATFLTEWGECCVLTY